MAVLARRQIRARPAAHRPPEKNHVTFFDTGHLREVVVDGVGVLFHLLLIWLTGFVEAIAWVLDSEDVHLHLSSEHVEQIEGKTDILRVPVEINHDLVASILAGQVQAWDILRVLLI